MFLGLMVQRSTLSAVPCSQHVALGMLGVSLDADLCLQKEGDAVTPLRRNSRQPTNSEQAVNGKASYQPDFTIHVVIYNAQHAFYVVDSAMLQHTE